MSSMKMKVTTRMMTRAALFGVLTFILGFIQIPIGHVPVTLQTLAVLMAGLLLKPLTACLAMLLHMLLKIVLWGASPFVSPSFGFVIAFVIAAPFLSYLTQKRNEKRVSMVFNLVIVTFLIYLIGLPYMVLVLRYYMKQTLSFGNILMMGMVVFLPGDFFKAVLAWFLAHRLSLYTTYTTRLE